MRKQTKLVAVASAAALLAIGASMTSFAATGWVEENGEWFFYEKDGTKAEDVWKRSGDKWFWLDSEENGAMAIDKLVEDGDNLYYVDSTGAMVSNTWVKVVNEEQDDDDDPAEYNYYYMQNNGKAHKAGDSGTTKFKTIDGKRYAFDEDGKMLYGWVASDGTRLTGEDDWATTSSDDVYYCGNWDDGAMKTGWQKITVYDSEEDEDMDYWFWFKSNGKRFVKSADDVNFSEKTVNGKKYGFDERGVMVYEWNLATADVAGAGTASNWKYFSSPEDGARKTKGWFKVIAADEDTTFGDFAGTFDEGNADDETEKWYYSDGDGFLTEGVIKRIKGKYYGFAPETGYMLNGLVFMETDGSGNIIKVWDDGVDSDELDDIIDNKFGAYDGFDSAAAANASLYYFGNDEDTDGAMKTGATTVNLDGNTYNFLFSKTGGADGKGKGLTGIDDDKYVYKYGMRIKAGGDDKYRVVFADGTITDDSVTVNKVSSANLRKAAYGMLDDFKNKDGDTVKYNNSAFTNCYLVNTSGTIVKNKTAAKDGDEWYFYVDDKVIRLYANNKTIKPKTNDKGENQNIGNLDLSDWKNDFDSSTK